MSKGSIAIAACGLFWLFLLGYLSYKSETWFDWNKDWSNTTKIEYGERYDCC